MNSAVGAITAVLSAIIGVAIVAVIVSQRSQTASVIQSAGSAFSGILGTALAPVTGATSPGIGSIATQLGSSLASGLASPGGFVSPFGQ